MKNVSLADSHTSLSVFFRYKIIRIIFEKSCAADKTVETILHS